MSARAKEEKLNIGMVSCQVEEAGTVTFYSFLDLVRRLASEVYVISDGPAGSIPLLASDQIHVSLVKQKATANKFRVVTNNILLQLKVSYNLAKVSRQVDLWIFFHGGPVLVLPVLTAKLVRSRVILVLVGSDAIEAKIKYGSFMGKVVGFLTKLSCTLSNTIILYSKRLIKEWGLEKYKDKILVAHQHFLALDKFRIEKSPEDRGNLVGYIGRLSEEKGVLSLPEAILRLLDKRDDISFLIGGDGQLRSSLEESLTNKAQFVGWIPHDELPKYLNELKLLVLPSVTEGLPTTVLEAMACGTLVLATPVGAIPDVIIDGETGFIMEDNSPECIARNVMRVLTCPNLNEIINKARAFVEREYTCEAVLEGYRNVLSK